MGLKAWTMSVLNASVPMSEFTVVYAGLLATKHLSNYLCIPVWVEASKLTVKGVNQVPITKQMMANTDNLALALGPRLDYHVAEQVGRSRRNHWTLCFTHDDIDSMAAAMFLVGHIVDDLETYSMDEQLLILPTKEMFQIMS